jgi:hypothetical protein
LTDVHRFCAKSRACHFQRQTPKFVIFGVSFNSNFPKNFNQQQKMRFLSELPQNYPTPQTFIPEKFSKPKSQHLHAL